MFNNIISDIPVKLYNVYIYINFSGESHFIFHSMRKIKAFSFQ